MSIDRTPSIKVGEAKYINVETRRPPVACAPRQSRPGGGGSIGEFAPAVDLMFSFSLLPGAQANTTEARLDVAVIVRRVVAPVHPRPAQGEAADWNPIPAGAGQGSGSTIGAHQLYCDRENRTLWLDGSPLIALLDANIVLLQEQDERLVLAGTDFVDAELGIMTPHSVATQTADLCERIRAAVGRSRVAAKYLSSR